MAKRKPSRPETRTAPPVPDDTLRQFTMKSWAVTAGVLKSRRDVGAVLDLLGFFDWLGDQNMQAIGRMTFALACRDGCAFCCYVGADQPDLLPAEALRIAKYLESHPDVQKGVEARLPEEASDKAPCLFLREDRCMVYSVRPMRCRAQTSLDAVLCEQNYRGQRKTMPLLKEPALLYYSLSMGLRLGLRDVDVQDAPLRMRPAIRLALDAPQVWERWLAGQVVLDAVLYPEPAEGVQSMARFMERSRVHLGVERQMMQRIISMCLNAPGVWARYAIEGMAPG